MITLLALLAVSQQAKAMEKPELHVVKFRYSAPVVCKSVHLMGSFNGWSRTSHPMTQSADGLRWESTASLLPGVYSFRFLVNSQDELTSPEYAIKHTKDQPDANTLAIRPNEYSRLPGRLGDGIVSASALQHRPSTEDVKRLSDHVMKLTFRTRHSDVENVLLEVWQAGEQKIYPMVRAAEDELFDYHTVRISVDPATQIEYFFILKDGLESFRFCKDGLTPNLLVTSRFKILPREYAIEKKTESLKH